MKKYLYFVIPIIIFLIMVLSFICLYQNKKDVNSTVMNEVINETLEVNNENINTIEPEDDSPETVNNEDLITESEIKQVDEVVKKENTKSTTSVSNSNSSIKTTSTIKKETSTENIKKEESKVTVKVEEKKEETKPSLPQTTESTIPKEDSTTSNDNTKTEEVKTEEIVVRCTTNHNHSIGVGNCGKWYSSTSEGIAEYDSIISYWGTKWEMFEIDNDTYYSKCPSGYQYISCMYCGRYTFDYYYRK